jgi:hypothetical protein
VAPAHTTLCTQHTPTTSRVVASRRLLLLLPRVLCGYLLGIHLHRLLVTLLLLLLLLQLCGCRSRRRCCRCCCRVQSRMQREEL